MMIIHHLGVTNSIANQYLAELRDPMRQSNRFLFRRNLTRLGTIMAYEISKELSYQERAITTPLGKKNMNIPASDVVLLTVLRAGLPFLEGFQHVFDQADTGFVGAFRVEGAAELRIQAGYVAVPRLEGKQVVLIDTMLATGRSLADAIAGITAQGQPSHIHMANVIAAPEGIRYLEENTKVPLTLWTFAIDDRLNSDYYIVPGLGDAGDLSYGSKT